LSRDATGLLLTLAEKVDPSCRAPLVLHIEKETIGDFYGVPSRGRAFAIEWLRTRIVGRVPMFAGAGGFSAEVIAAGVLEIRRGRHASWHPETYRRSNAIERHRSSSACRTIQRSYYDRFAELAEVCVEAKVGGLKSRATGHHHVVLYFSLPSRSAML
jgi:dihydroorotate dehydrogenase